MTSIFQFKFFFFFIFYYVGYSASPLWWLTRSTFGLNWPSSFSHLQIFQTSLPFTINSSICWFSSPCYPISHIDFSFDPIQYVGGGGGAKSPPLPVSPVTSTNVGISPQNFLNFSFNPVERLVWSFKFVPSASPKLLHLNQDHPSQKPVFLVKSLRLW